MKFTKICFMLFFAIFLVSCSNVSKKNLEKSIIGKWADGEENIEFFKDGTISISGGDMGGIFGKASNGDYRFIDRDRIRIELGGAMALVGPMIFRAQISNDILTLTHSESGTHKYRKANSLPDKRIVGTNGKEEDSTDIPDEVKTSLYALRTCEEAYKHVYGVYRECETYPNELNGANYIGWNPKESSGYNYIGFAPEHIRTRFQYEIKVNRDDGTFMAIAIGDLNGNGKKATYTLKSNAPQKIDKNPLDEY